MANTFHDGPYTRLPADEQSAITYDGTTVSASALSMSTLTVLGANIIFSSLPTSEPVTVGALWIDSGALKVSDGP